MSEPVRACGKNQRISQEKQARNLSTHEKKGRETKSCLCDMKNNIAQYGYVPYVT